MDDVTRLLQDIFEHEREYEQEDILCIWSDGQTGAHPNITMVKFDDGWVYYSDGDN